VIAVVVGIASEGRLLAIYGASILETHNLAKRILEQRRLFRKRPEHWDRRRKPGSSAASQLSLFPADPPSR
jgi:hypothetical protein